MRILFCTLEYPPEAHGGIGSFVRTLSRALGEAGHRCFVVVPRENKREARWCTDDGVTVVEVPVPTRWKKGLSLGRYWLSPYFLAERVSLTSWVHRIAKQEAVDVVESHDWGGPLWNKPWYNLVVRLHGAHSACYFYRGLRPSRLTRWAEKRNVVMADHLVAVSRFIGVITMKALRLERPFQVIYNGVDTSKFSPRPVRREKAEILYVGTIAPRKGAVELLRAVPLVLQEVKDATFTFVGPLPSDGEYKRVIEPLLSSLGEEARRRVKFVGRVGHDQLPEVYSRATLAVFPSKVEAFGLTCVEAMACATPVIFSKLGSGPEVVEDGVSGLLVDPFSPEDLAAKIVWLLKNDEVRVVLARNARKRAEERFSAAAILTQNIALYEGLLNGK